MATAAASLTAIEGWEAFSRHANPGLGAFLRLTGRDRRFVRARGVEVEDDEGRRFDDWFAAFGCLALGHNPEALLAAARAQLEAGGPNLFPEALNPHAGALAERLVRAAGPGFETALLTSGGSEAIDAALKTAVLATRRPRVVFADGAYHGTTLGALACATHGPYRADLDAVLPRFTEVPLGDVAALERALAPGDVAALVLEPIQVEAGVRVPPEAWLRIARAFCARAGTLFVLDETQTGLGRTGRMFAFEAADAAPDILVLARALGGGVVPIGATVLARGIWHRAYGGRGRRELHGTTLGGNALACRVALAVLDAIEAPGFLGGVRGRGEALAGALADALGRSKAVERITVTGLLGAVRFRPDAAGRLGFASLGLEDLADRPSAGALVVERLSRRGILAQLCAHDWSSVRIQPPLIVSTEACGRFVAALADAVGWLEENA